MIMLSVLPDGHSLQSRATVGHVNDAADYLLPKDVSRRFGRRLRELRCLRNYRLLQMTRDLGIDLGYLQKVEEGKECLSLATLEVIALGINIPLPQLLQEL